MPAGTRQSTFSSARAGITLIFSDASMIVGAKVTPHVGSTIAASRSSTPRDAAQRAVGIVRVEPERGQEGARLVGEVEARAAVAEPLDVAAAA